MFITSGFECIKVDDEKYKVVREGGDVPIFYITKAVYEKEDAVIICSCLDRCIEEDRGGGVAVFDCIEGKMFLLDIGLEFSITGEHGGDLVRIKCSEANIANCGLKVLNPDGITCDNIILDNLGECSIDFRSKLDSLHILDTYCLGLTCKGRNIHLERVNKKYASVRTCEFLVDNVLWLKDVNMIPSRYKGSIQAESIALDSVNIHNNCDYEVRCKGRFVIDNSINDGNNTIVDDDDGEEYSIESGLYYVGKLAFGREEEEGSRYGLYKFDGSLIAKGVDEVYLCGEVNVNTDLNIEGEKGEHGGLEYSRFYSLTLDDAIINGQGDTMSVKNLSLANSDISFDKYDNVENLELKGVGSEGLGLENIRDLKITGEGFAGLKINKSTFSNIDSCEVTSSDSCIIRNCAFDGLRSLNMEGSRTYMKRCEVMNGNIRLINTGIENSSLKNGVSVSEGDTTILYSTLDNATLKGVTICDHSDIRNSEITDIPDVVSLTLSYEKATLARGWSEEFSNSEIVVSDKSNIMGGVEL